MKLMAPAVVVLLLSISVLAQAPPPAFAVKQFNDGAYWIVLESFVYQIGTTRLSVEVPKGFVTDFASIPKQFTAIFLPTGRYARAAAIHDFLYWTQSCSREQADRILLLAMIESDVPYATRRAIYRAVRLGGESSWLANQKERQAGLPRVIPEDFLKIDPLDVWSAYRQRLSQAGVQADTLPTQVPSYCAADERDLH